MLDRNYYVLCDSNCKFPSMTKEQILAAIAEATGNTPTKVDDAFITKIKETNGSVGLKFWVGTSAEFNAIAEKSENTLYILTDDDTVNAIEERFDVNERNIEANSERFVNNTKAIETNASNISKNTKNISANKTKIDAIYDVASTLKIGNAQTDDYVDVTYSDDTIIHEDVLSGLYMVRVSNNNVGTRTRCSFMLDFSGTRTVYSSVFRYDDGKGGCPEAVVMAESSDGMGAFHLKVVSSPTSTTEIAGFTISVRKIGENYLVG